MIGVYENDVETASTKENNISVDNQLIYNISESTEKNIDIDLVTQASYNIKATKINTEDIDVITSTVVINNSGGTYDYTDLTNKPKINGIELNGDISLSIPTITFIKWED